MIIQGGENMDYSVLFGLLIPFLGTTLGSNTVYYFNTIYHRNVYFYHYAIIREIYNLDYYDEWIGFLIKYN